MSLICVKREKISKQKECLDWLDSIHPKYISVVDTGLNEYVIFDLVSNILYTSATKVGLEFVLPEQFCIHIANHFKIEPFSIVFEPKKATQNKGCKFDTDGDGNCHIHPEGCPPKVKRYAMILNSFNGKPELIETESSYHKVKYVNESDFVALEKRLHDLEDAVRSEREGTLTMDQDVTITEAIESSEARQ